MLRNKKTFQVIYSNEIEIDDLLNEKKIYIPKLTKLLEWQLKFKWINWPYSIIHIVLTLLGGVGWTGYKEFVFKKVFEEQKLTCENTLKNEKLAFKKNFEDQEIAFKKIHIAYTKAEKKLKDQIDQMKGQRKIASTNECPNVSNLSEVKLYIKKP